MPTPTSNTAPSMANRHWHLLRASCRQQAMLQPLLPNQLLETQHHHLLQVDRCQSMRSVEVRGGLEVVHAKLALLALTLANTTLSACKSPHAGHTLGGGMKIWDDGICFVNILSILYILYCQCENLSLSFE